MSPSALRTGNCETTLACARGSEPVRPQDRRLGDFVAFMENRKAKTVTTAKLAMEWATLPPDRHASCGGCGWPRAQGSRIDLDPRTEDRPSASRSYRVEACQALCLQRRADRCSAGGGDEDLPPEDGLRRWTYHTLFGLIAVETGVRLSEAMGLGIERDDVDLDGRADSPADQVRQIAARAIASDEASRCAATPTGAMRCSSSSSTFVAEQGGRLLHRSRPSWRCSRSGCDAPRQWSRTACTTSGTASPSGRCSIGIAKVENVEQQLPALSTYLGQRLYTGRLLVSLGLPGVDGRSGVSIGDGRRRHEARL